MASYLHVFVEDDPADARDHLDTWFGFPRPDFLNDDPFRPVVCFCGARREALDASTVAVWHLLDIGAVNGKYGAMEGDW